MKNNILFVCLFLISIPNFSQQKLPDIQDLVHVPNSPEAAAFTKYGGLPVNYYLGSPNISIPIYTIQGKELSLPLSVSYDASGIKVNQLASSVGLGWNFNYGGVVQRTTHGLPDRGSEPYHKIYSSTVQNLKQHFRNGGTFSGPFSSATERQIAKNALDDYQDGNLDFEADTFTFSINGLSGVIYIDYTTITNGKYRVFCIDQPNIKVDYTLSNNEIYQWIITDENGTIYTFSNKEYTLNSYVSMTNEYENAFISAWYISKIESPNKKDILTFNYSIGVYWQSRTEAPNKIIEHNKSCNSSGGGALGGQKSTPVYTQTTLPIVSNSYKIKQFNLQNIKLNDKLVVLVSNSNGRADLPAKSKIDAIDIYNNIGQTIKKFQFSYSYFTTNPSFASIVSPRYNVRLKLDRIAQIPVGSNNQGLQNKTYRFDYYSPNTLPSNDSASQDYWGYFNGSNHHYMIAGNHGNRTNQYNAIFYGQTFGGDTERLAHTNFSKIGTLSKIHYPTGGTTEFIYEGHKDRNNQIQSGGLRIKKMIDRDADNTITHIKELDFGTGTIHQKLKFSKSFTETRINSCINNNVREPFYKLQRYSYNIATPTKYAITYASATEKIIDPATNLANGSTTYTFKEGAYGIYTGQTSDYIGGKPTGYTIKNTQNSTVKSEVSSYSIQNLETLPKKIELESRTTDINVCLNYSYYGGNYWMSIGEKNSKGKCNNYGGNQGFPLGSYTHQFIQRYTLYKRRVKLDKVITTEKLPTPVVTTTTYQYNNAKHNKPVTTLSTTSDGQAQKSVVTYVEDIANPTVAEQILINNHRIATPITVVSYKNGQKLATQKTIYHKWGGNRSMPKAIQTAKRNDGLEDRINYHAYDTTTGDPIEVSKKNGGHVIYIWGYQKTVPIAKIENATYSQVSSQVSSLQTKSDADNDRTIGNTGKEGILRTALQNLRNSLPNALVTTYTYDPQIGVTSMTDPSGYTSYYVYDGFNRLQFIKNANGEVLEQYDYNYAPSGDLRVTLVPSTTTVVSGQEVTITRHVTGGSGTYNVQWTINNANLSQYALDQNGAITIKTTNNHTPRFAVTCLITDTQSGDSVSSTVQIEVR